MKVSVEIQRNLRVFPDADLTKSLYVVGDILSLDKHIAEKLIRQGFAKLPETENKMVEPKLETKPAPKPRKKRVTKKVVKNDE